jgi:hypothetical protein
MPEYDCKENSFHPPNPVHEHNDGTWWFYLETWADEAGPYESEEQANKMLTRYGHEVLGVD